MYFFKLNKLTYIFKAYFIKFIIYKQIYFFYIFNKFLNKSIIKSY